MQPIRFSFVRAALAGFFSLCGMCLPAAGQVGGGTTIGGLDAEYFANASLSGSPAFTRRDVRVDFSWGTVLSPSGVNTQPGYRDFPKDNFSVGGAG